MFKQNSIRSRLQTGASFWPCGVLTHVLPLPPLFVPVLSSEDEWVPLELCFGMPLFSSELNRKVCRKIASHKLFSSERWNEQKPPAINIWHVDFVKTTERSVDVCCNRGRFNLFVCLFVWFQPSRAAVLQQKAFAQGAELRSVIPGKSWSYICIITNWSLFY